MYIKIISYKLSYYAELKGGLTAFNQNTKIKNTMDKVTLAEMIVSDYLDQAVRSQLYGIKNGKDLQYYIRTDYGIYGLRPDGQFFSPKSDNLYPIVITPFDWAVRNAISTFPKKVATPSDYPDEGNMKKILWSEIGKAFTQAYEKEFFDKPKAQDVLLSLQRR